MIRRPEIMRSDTSHPSRGGWIEIGLMAMRCLRNWCPTPRGVGGLKCGLCGFDQNPAQSHPSRGGWIEIATTSTAPKPPRIPTPLGVGGLKCRNADSIREGHRPTPRGVGGLKSSENGKLYTSGLSHPSRGGWIEIRIVMSLEVVMGNCPTPRGVGGLKFCSGPVAHSSAEVPPLAGWVD